MARLPRFILPGEPRHVIQRGNNRNVIFSSDEDYCLYLDKLEEACQRYRCHIHAYVLMTNHVRPLMTPDRKYSISQVMQSLGRSYVRYFNEWYRRTGTLCKGRYKATLLDSESYLLTCYRYIELNPVRAGMVSKSIESDPIDYFRFLQFESFVHSVFSVAQFFGFHRIWVKSRIKKARAMPWLSGCTSKAPTRQFPEERYSSPGL